MSGSARRPAHSSPASHQRQGAQGHESGHEVKQVGLHPPMLKAARGLRQLQDGPSGRLDHEIQDGLGRMLLSRRAPGKAPAGGWPRRCGRRIQPNQSVMMPANEPAVYCIRAVGAA